MSLSFPQLEAQYGTAPAVPDDVLYQYLLELKPDLINLAALGDRQVPGTALGREVRRRAKRDLFWLVRYFLWETNPVGAGQPVTENGFTEAEYRVMTDFFVQKDDTKSVREQDPVIKTRVLLWPRGGLKSTCDVADAVQWILNFPDIRILFLTGKDDLAVGFIREVKGHFLAQEGEPSLMNLFFPEFCLTEQELPNQYEFTCPVWAARNIKRKEPTILSASIGETKSGWHFEVIKPDDAVSDKNSESSEQCQTVSQKLLLAKNLLRAGGYYVEYIGTRYHDDDHYGVLIEKNVGELQATHGKCWDMTENAVTGTRILIGQAIRIKPERRLELEREGLRVDYLAAGADGCELLLPKLMPYDWLMREYRDDEVIFEAQKNQNPRPQTQTVFERALLVKHTVSYQQMPFNGPVSQTWDFAFSPKKGRDFTTGASVIWDERGRMFVNGLIRQRFPRPQELAKAVVDFAVQHRPFIVGIEDTMGSKFLYPTIQDEARKTGDPYIIDLMNRIDWYPPENQKDAKRMRMGALQPWLMDGRLKFANYLPPLEMLYSEFERCMGSHHHDDIPDVISQQPRYAPRTMRLFAEHKVSSIDRGAAEWNLLFNEGDAFGRPGWATPGPVVDTRPAAEMETAVPAPGYDSMLGAGICG